MANDVYRRINPKAAEFLKKGMLFEDLIRTNVAEGRVMEALGREEEFIRERMEQHRNPKGQIIRQFSDGKWYILKETRTPEGGTALTFTDITELRTAKEAEERLSQAVETVPVGIALFDSDDTLVFFNSRYGELMEVMADILKPGVTFEEIIRTIVDRQPVKDARGREEEFIQERIKHHRNPTGPFDIRRDNMWLSADETRLADGSIFTIIIDITERKKAEQALRQSEDLLNSIIENVPVGLLIKDPDHIVERANDTYLRWYGFNTDTIAGRRSDEIEDFQSAEEAAFMNAQEREVLTTGRTKTRQVDRLFADGQMHTLNITKFPVYDQQGNISKVGSVSVDLTEQVQAQKIANAALQEAETANRAKSEFLASMSHELRTPLNAILGFADIITHQYFGPTGEKYTEYAEDIQSSGEHLLALINEILDLSTIEAGKQPLVKEKLSIKEIVGECIRIIEDKARSNGIDLVTKIPKDLPPLYADRRAFKQILLNLLSNAVKFTSEGGKITVSAKASKRNTTLKIADTGKGIPAAKLPKLTDPFTQVDGDPYLAEPGWGLGLSISKSLVDLHDGTLDIKSTVGKGTTVTVTLPSGTP